MSAASMSRLTIKACVGIYLKNRRKTEFIQQMVIKLTESTNGTIFDVITRHGNHIDK